ncbi:TonB-dependent receptor [Luteimonas mephitis]|uniref:TonB-dependent receptor n=1 Tax=Luteimonas mephitis TaxID=83615 RepID=UPI003A8EA021
MLHAPLGQAVRRALLATTLVGAAPAVLAQEAQAPRTLDRIVVTGSNIPRTDTETASPVQVITRQEIDRTGKTTVAEYLQTLTSDGAGSIPKTFGNGFASGGAGVSLRGLGAGSTLILLNGRRMAPFGLADDGQKVFTDLSTIPLEAVERIDVLKDGASAIYGSDAIAGVVNVILRKDFTGAVIKGSYGTSGDSDGNQRKASITAGTGDLAKDGFNFFFSLEAAKTDAINVSDRRNRKWIGTGDIRPWGYDIGAATANGFLQGNITPGAIDPDTGIQGPGNSGSTPNGAVRDPVTLQYVSLPGCSQFSSVAPQDPNGGCLWDAAGLYRNLTPKEEYINFFSRGTFAISDETEFYTELSYSKKTNDFNNTPSGVSGSWGYPGGPVNASSGPGATVLGADHPDNPYGVPVRLRYSAFDVGPRTNHNESSFMRFLLGMNGMLGEWDYDVAYLHSQTDLTNTRTGFLRYSRVADVLTNPDSPVGYWRIGANSGLNSQALYDYISPTISARASSKLDMIDARAQRSLMDLRGGALGLALGLEYRRQTVELTPQTFTDIGDIIGLGYSAYDGKEQVASAYAELQAPVLESLELNAAVRVDSYEGGETSTTPKVGFKWKPMDWIALRATYAEGFRAPNPAESGKGGLAAFSNAQDPIRCPDGVNPAPGGTPADCQAQAVAIITSPNPDLKPEQAKSYTVGLVLDPTPSTSLTLDAFEIKRTDEILGGDPAGVIAANGDNVLRNDNDLPGLPHSGTLLAVSTGYINANATTVRGFDFDARQRFDLGNAGQLTLDLQWTRINSFKRDLDATFNPDGSLATAAESREYAGTHGNCDVTNCIGTPKDRANFGATWDVNAFKLSTVVNYRGSMDNTPWRGQPCASQFADGSPAPSGCELKSFYTIDLSGSWKPTESWEIFGSVANVTDRIAPLDPLTYGGVNYNPLDFSGALGRYYTIGVKYTFK